MTPRLLYVPNEWPHHTQLGPRRALERLRDYRLISDLAIISPLGLMRGGRSRNEALNALESIVADFRPNIVLVQHPSGSGLDDEQWARMKAASPFFLLLHEGDCYGSLRKRLPPDTAATARAADLVLTVGASTQLSLLKRIGARAVEWTPSTYDTARFQRLSNAHRRQRRWDVVMMANHSPSRIPGLSMPGTRGRLDLYRRLERRFGDRFAAFGRQWPGASAAGVVAFDHQQEVLRDAWVSTTWDHFPHEAKFFSDRLPIALVSGSHHVGTLHPGYDVVFADAPPGIRFASSVKEAERMICEAIDLARSSNGKNVSSDLADYSESFRDDIWLVNWLRLAGFDIDYRDALRAFTDA